MIRSFSLAEIASPLNAELNGTNAETVSFDQVSTDTRSIVDGDLFVALKGERFDAHNFLSQAAEAGAGALLVERFDETVLLPQVRVEDSTRAMGKLAQLNRSLFDKPVIALTGSCGKTTVKEMLASVLGQDQQVHVTQGNLNNHIGVPQTLLALSDDADVAVIEMGASALGEIDYLADIAQPDVALVNNVMPAHLEGFGSKDGVAAEKSNIYRQLRQGGTAVINADEPYAADWVEELNNKRADLKQLTFSCGEQEANVVARNIELGVAGCYRFDLHAGGNEVQVQLPLLGRQNVDNALAVTACSLAVGLDLQKIASGLEKSKPFKGRLVPMLGRNHSLVIDDSYNANLGSVLAAASVLTDLEHQGKQAILVLGDLGELGDGDLEILLKLGRDLAQLGILQLYTQGVNSELIHAGFSEAAEDGVSQHFVEKDELNSHLLTHLKNNTVVLVKGSRSARMEQVVQAITLGGEQ